LRADILSRCAGRHLNAITRFDVERMVNEIVAARRSPATAEKALRIAEAVGITRRSAHKRWRHLKARPRACRGAGSPLPLLPLAVRRALDPPVAVRSTVVGCQAGE
jgi:hypothetical protein